MMQIRINQWVLSPSANILVGLIGLITSIIIARNLGPSLRGIFAEAILWPTLVLALGSLVNTQSVVFFWSKAKVDNTTNRVLGASILWSVLLSVILILISWGINYIVLGSNEKISYIPANIYSLIIPILLISYAVTPIFLVEKRMGIYWSLRLASSILYLVGVITLTILGKFSIINLIFILIASQFFPLLMSAVLVQVNFRVRPVWHRVTFLSLANYGFKVNLTGLPYQLNLRIDQTLMSLFLSARVLGYYTVAFSWASSLSFIGVGLSVVMLVRSASIDFNDREKLIIIFGQLRIVFISLLIIGLFIALSTPILLPKLFGIEFLPSVIPGIILCIAGIFLGLNIVLHELIRGLGFPELGIRAEVLGLVISLILLYLLLPIWGGTGAAIASTISYSIVSITLVLLLSRKINFKYSEIVIPRKADFAELSNRILSTFHNYKIQFLNEK